MRNAPRSAPEIVVRPHPLWPLAFVIGMIGVAVGWLSMRSGRWSIGFELFGLNAQAFAYALGSWSGLLMVYALIRMFDRGEVASGRGEEKSFWTEGIAGTDWGGAERKPDPKALPDDDPLRKRLRDGAYRIYFGTLATVALSLIVAGSIGVVRTGRYFDRFGNEWNGPAVAIAALLHLLSLPIIAYGIYRTEKGLPFWPRRRR